MLVSASHDPDIEAQIQKNNSDSESCSSKHSHMTSHGINEGDRQAHSTPEVTLNKPHVDTSHPHHEAPSAADAPPAQSEWKPLKADEPLFTKIPESNNVKEEWVKAMGEADDGMCRGWKDQIDMLIIFAGLFSATVTAFTVESYQWLDETPANTLARLQLRDLLNATHDPAMNHLAPATFHVSSASVAINTLWFASLTFSLAAVDVSILCKQWLHEYQRYDNFTLDEAFLIRGLRLRGLQAWKVPQIISFLPLLLQIALVLFLVGVLILLWSLQAVVASFTTLIIGVTFLFLVITTILPSIQYLVPMFETQCAYKSSQSWSFLNISAFWLFDPKEFTSWGSIDQWEIEHIDDGMGRTLSWVYKSFSQSCNSFLNVYSIIVDKSLKPTFNRDLAVLPDFFDELGTSSSQNRTIIKDAQNLSKTIGILQNHGRTSRLRLSCQLTFHSGRRKYELWNELFASSYPGRSNLIQSLPISKYYPRTHSILYLFLRHSFHSDHRMFFDRSIEHWARGLEFKDDIPMDSVIHILRSETYPVPTLYEPTEWLIGFFTHLFQRSQFPQHTAVLFIPRCYPKLMESHYQSKLGPSPVTLLKSAQEWINQALESASKPSKILDVLLGFRSSPTFLETLSKCHTTDLEKQYLISFIRFLVDCSDTEEFQQRQDLNNYWHAKIPAILVSFRKYLDESATIPPSDLDLNDLSLQSPGSTEAVTENT